jgi:hypothetical protein
MIGSAKVRITCLSCGEEWIPGILARQPTPSSGSRHVLGWFLALSLLVLFTMTALVKARVPALFFGDPTLDPDYDRALATDQHFGSKRQSRQSGVASAKQVHDAIKASDDFEQHMQAFMVATLKLIQDRTCSLDDLRENGGWVRSSSHEGRPVYFVYCGGLQRSNRIYLDVSTGAVFR